MKTLLGWKSGTCLIALLAASLAHGATYYVAVVGVTDLGNLGGIPSAPDSGAIDINNRGEIVGYSKDATMFRRPFLWRSGVMIDLGTPTTSARAVASGINDSGEVVGSYGDPDEFNWQAFHWSPAGGVTTLNRSLYPGLPFDSDYTARANAINKVGIIAGLVESRPLDDSIPHAPCFRSLPVRWPNRLASPQILHCTAAGEESNSATDINNSGWIVGTDGNGSSADVPFIWKAGITTTLPSPNPGTSVHAVGINEKGTVVGYATLSGAFRALRWDSATLSPSWLPLLPGGTHGFAFEVNDEEFIAGSADAAVAAGTVLDRAYLWHADFGMFALPVPPGMSPLTTTCSARSLNNRLSSTGVVQVVGGCQGHAIRWSVRVLIH